MSTKFSVFMLLAFFVILSSSCKDKTAKGDGKNGTKVIDVEVYEKIKIEGDFDLVYEMKPDEAAYLRLEADENIIPLIEVKAKRGTLNLNAKDNIFPNRVTVYTNSPTLKYVETKGSSSVHLKGLVEGKEFKFESRGEGHFRADNLIYSEAEFYLLGAGGIDLAGIAVKAKMQIAGNGDINALGLAVDQLNCEIKGNGSMRVNAVEKLSIEIKGNGNITYKGNPQITKQQIKGSGTVKAER